MALFQGAGKASQRKDLEMAASDNPALKNVFVDPLLVCTAFKKHRFYLFSRRQPDDSRRWDKKAHKKENICKKNNITLLGLDFT